MGPLSPYSPEERLTRKHNLLVNVFLLTYFTVSQCTAMPHIMVFHQEASPKVVEQLRQQQQNLALPCSKGSGAPMALHS